jgi:hypothetical protein
MLDQFRPDSRDVCVHKPTEESPSLTRWQPPEPTGEHQFDHSANIDKSHARKRTRVNGPFDRRGRKDRSTQGDDVTCEVWRGLSGHIEGFSFAHLASPIRRSFALNENWKSVIRMTLQITFRARP